jgi:hypothetical protein
MAAVAVAAAAVTTGAPASAGSEPVAQDLTELERHLECDWRRSAASWAAGRRPPDRSHPSADGRTCAPAPDNPREEGMVRGNAGQTRAAAE